MTAVHSTKWFWSDWRGDEAVRRLTPAERGVWIDLLALAAAGSPTGYVTDTKGRQLSLGEIGRFTNCGDLEELAKLIDAIEEKGAASRDRAGRLFNRRMVRDAALSLKRKCAAEIRHKPKKQKDKQVLHMQNLEKEEDKDSSSSSADPIEKSQVKKPEIGTARARDDGWAADAFEQFYAAYPNKVGKQAAKAAFDRIRRSGGVDFPTLMAGLLRYVAKTDDRPWCNPATWLNQHRWEDQPATINRNGDPNGEHWQARANGRGTGRGGFASFAVESARAAGLFDEEPAKAT